MRLVPPYSTILSMSNRGKYVTLIARQVAFSYKLGIGTTWEMSTNLLLDKPHPQTKLSLRQILLDIPSQAFINRPLRHIMDRQWRSERGVSFGFTPENESDARSITAGLIPYLRAIQDKWYLSALSSDTLAQHASSKWNSSQMMTN
jgi:hypothetical protein